MKTNKKHIHAGKLFLAAWFLVFCLSTVAVTAHALDAEKSVSIHLVEAETGEPISGVQLTLNRIFSPGGFDIGNPETLATWNTEEENPFVYTEPLYGSNHRYIVSADTLPEGYTWQWRNEIQASFRSDVGSDFVIELQKDEEIPLTGTYSMNVEIWDRNREELMKNEDLECELFNYQTGEVVATWNAADEPTKHFEELQYAFDENHSATHYYLIRFVSLPEGYTVDSSWTEVNTSYVHGAYLYQFYNQNEFDKRVYLRDTSPDAPQITYKSTMHGQATQSTSATNDTNTSATIGDVNGDNAVDMKDVLVLRKFIANLGNITEGTGDLNGDSAVDMKDVLALRQAIAGVSSNGEIVH